MRHLQTAGDKSCHMQGDPHKTINRSGFLFAGQERGGWYIQNIERKKKKTSTKNTICDQSCPLEVRKDKDFEQTKAKKVHHH